MCKYASTIEGSDGVWGYISYLGCEGGVKIISVGSLAPLQGEYGLFLVSICKPCSTICGARSGFAAWIMYPPGDHLGDVGGCPAQDYEMSLKSSAKFLNNSHIAFQDRLAAKVCRSLLAPARLVLRELPFQILGVGIQGLGIRIQGLGFRIQGCRGPGIIGFTEGLGSLA